MKKFLLPLLVITLVFITVGCKSKSSSNGIIGSWENNEEGSVVITFKDSGTGYTTFNGEKYDDVKYTYENEILTIKYQTIMETELKYNCIIDKDVMTIKEGNTFIAEYKRLKD